MAAQDSDSSSSGGLQDGPDIGIEGGAALGSEAIGDLAEDDAGPECLFGAVIGGRDGAVGEEDEQVLAAALDDAKQHPARRGGRHGLEQFVEPGLETGMIDGQGRIGQAWPATADAGGPFQQGLEAGGQGVVAAVDGILDVAQQMGEADLMILGRPPHPGGEAVGHPEIGAGSAEEFRDHLLAARRADEKAGAIAVVEDPVPEGPLADADGGLVGFERGAR